ncbi:MAG: hypothetical protein ACFFAE_18955 [Candidatus Hodarchaeota archaeon]
MTKYLKASVKLHDYIVTNHWNGKGIFGPDNGVRFNYRIGRFLKSYMRFINWKDNYYYLQAQGYWVMGNWILHDIWGEKKYSDIAMNCSSYVLERQQKDGYWEYPNPAWKGRITTVEGTFAALGLLESYKRTNEKNFLNGALKWYDFANREVGYREFNDSLAINYFAKRTSALVPNNSTLQLMFLATLYEYTKKEQYLSFVDPLVKFIDYVQRQSGELPYAVSPESSNKIGMDHFLCYQYNAFQFLDLARCFDITQNPLIYGILRKLSLFLANGLKENGSAKYDCFSNNPEVTYFTAAMAAASLTGHRAKLGNLKNLSDKAYSRVLSVQKPDGRFHYSIKDYRFLSDRRPYPRALSMILYHLLLKAKECDKINHI